MPHLTSERLTGSTGSLLTARTCPLVALLRAARATDTAIDDAGTRAARGRDPDRPRADAIRK